MSKLPNKSSIADRKSNIEERSVTNNGSLVKIGQAANLLGVSIDTLRRWEKSGKITALKTPGGTRLYSIKDLEIVAGRSLAAVEEATPENSFTKVKEAVETPFSTPEWFKVEEPKDFSLEAEVEKSEYVSNSTQVIKKTSTVGRFIGTLFLASSLPLILTLVLLAFNLLLPTKAKEFFSPATKTLTADGKIISKSNSLISFVPKILSPFNGVAVKSIEIARGGEESGAPPGSDDNQVVVFSESSRTGGNSGVLAESTEGYFLEINADTTINGDLIAPNLIYSLTAGTNVTISEGQTPTISVVMPENLVNTVQGRSGAVTFLAGTDIAISGLTVSNTSTLSTVRGRGGCSTCIVSDDINTLVATKLTGTIESARLSGSYSGITGVGTLSALAVSGATTLSSTLDVTGAASFSSYLTLAQISAPSTTTNRLYNVSGDLVWNGVNLSAGGALPVGTTGQTIYNSSGTWTATNNLYHNGTNVGIGTTSPSSKLGILGNLSLGATYGTVAAPTSGLIVEGNVGIGTTSPGYKFVVNGSGLIQSDLLTSSTLFASKVDSPDNYSPQALAGTSKGAIWTEIGTNVLPLGVYYHQALIYDNRMWIIGGRATSGVSQKVYYSYDGVTWTEAGTNSLPTQLMEHGAVVYNGKMWVFGGWNGSDYTQKVYSSTDGITWTEAGTNAYPFKVGDIEPIVYNGKMWVFGGYNGTTSARSTKIYYSTDGVTWTEAGTNSIPYAGGLLDYASVAFKGKMWLIGGYSGSNSQKVYSSTDGSTWTESGTNVLPVAMSQNRVVVYDGKIWTTTGGYSPNYFYYSSDGTTWTAAAATSIGNTGLTELVVFNGKIYRLGGGASPYSKVYATETNINGPFAVRNYADSSELFRITDGGNVGIGTTSPAQALDVVGDINASAKYRIGNSIILHNTGTNNTFLGISSGNTTLTGTANTFIGTSSGNSITSGNNNTAAGYLSLNANTSGSQNTAFGYSALFSNTTATDNSAFGWDALYNNTTGIDNNAFGRQALYTNTTGNANSAVGRFALLSNTTGSNNVAFGNESLRSNTTASNLTAVGYQALYSNTTGTLNTALGYQSLYSNTTGTENTAVGNLAGYSITTGNYNTFLGKDAGYSTTTGSNNTFLGRFAGKSNTTGNQNIFLGLNSGLVNTTGSDNTFLGHASGQVNTTGSSNTFVGLSAGQANVVGTENTYLGTNAGYYSTGSYNTFVGKASGNLNTTGANNTALGYQALYTPSTVSNLTAIGYQSLYSNTTGTFNNALGYQTLYSNTTGTHNDAFGYQALYANTTGSYNLAFGFNALDSNTTGTQNIALGVNTLHTNTTGNYNTTMGTTALASNTTGSYNTAIGLINLQYNTTGNYNTSLGAESLRHSETGSSNTALGYRAGYGVSGNSYSNNSLFGYQSGLALTTGSNNILLGYSAGDNLTTGSNNIVLGYNIDAPSATSANTLNIGNLIFGTGIDGTGTTLSSGNIGIGTTAPAGILHVAGQCVTGDTKLKRRRRRKGNNGEWIEDWEDVAIKNIQPGDQILTLDEKTGEFIPSRVKALQDMGMQQTHLLITESGKQIRTTGNHPYFVREAEKPTILGGVFQVDQSPKMEDLTKDSFIAIANKEVHIIIQIDRNYKKQIYIQYFEEGRSRFFASDLFVNAIKTLLASKNIRPARLEIDTDYPGYEKRIKEMLGFSNPEISIEFRSLGHSATSFAHWAAYRAYKGEYQPTEVLKESIKKDRSTQRVGLGVVALVPLNQIRNTCDLSQKDYQKLDDLSSASWKKVYEIKPGMEIATIDGWERVISLKEYAREKVFDIEVEDTHNFVGNNIIAHNTAIFGAGEAGTPTATTLRGAAAAGTNIAGANFTFDASNGTGTGGSGALVFRTAPTGSTGSTANTLAEIMRITPGGNVGIGTTGPGAKLHTFATTEQLRLGYDASNYASFTTNSSGHLTINPSGSLTNLTSLVTINTNNGGEPLTVTTSVNSYLGATINNSSSGTSAMSRLLFQGNGSYADIGYTSSAFSDGTNYTGIGANTLLIANRANAPIVFNTNGITSSGERMRITGGGNVGIGTTAPGATLDIVSSITDAIGTRVTANSITTGDALRVVSTSTAGGASGSSIMLKLDRSGANSNTAHTAYGLYSTVTNTNATSGTNTAGYFSASGATTANFGIYSAAGTNYFNGNVGIGTTAPSQLLDLAFSSTGSVNGIQITGQYPSIYLTSNNSGGRRYQIINGLGASPVDILRFNDVTAGTDRMIINASGNIGIGANHYSPAAQLDILANASTAGLKLTGTAAGATTTTGAAASSILDITGATGQATSSILNHAAGAGGALSLTGGIGGAATGASGTQTGGAGGALTLTGGTGGAATSGTGGAGGSLYLVGGAAGSGGSASAGNVLLGITSGGTARGNVGIGTTSPNTLLELRNATTSTQELMRINAPTVAGSYSYLTVASANNPTGDRAVLGFLNQTASGDAGAFLSAGSSASPNSGVFVNASGNVGIGTTAPGAYRLNVNGNTNITGTLTTSSTITATGQLLLSDGSLSAPGLAFSADTDTGIYRIGANIMSMVTGGTNVLSLNGSNVGIGTTAPGAKLDVTDNANGTAFSVTNNTVTTATLGSITSTSLTTGTGLSMAFNGLTTGKALSITSTSTALTSGNLVNLDWSPGSSTTATGDLFKLNIGANGTTSGNLFNILDSSSSIFSISESSLTTSLPASFTAPGDLTAAYDINLTNPTASFIKSSAPLTIQAGESFNSSNLTLKTYNQGSIVFDSAVTTGTAVDIQNTTLTTGYGLSFTGPSSTGITGSALYAVSDIGSAGKLVNLAPDFSGSAVTGYGIYNAGTDSTANANTDYGYYGSLTLTGNAAKNGYGIYQTVTSSSTTADTLYAANLATSVTGVMTTGTRNVYGLYSNPSAGAESTGGTTNVYGGYFKADADVAAGGTVNGYGLYIANGAFDTDGTSTQYGLYVAEPTGADTNYSIYSAGGVNYFGGNVGIGTTAPTQKLDVNGSINIPANGTAWYRAQGNILLGDQGASITAVRSWSTAASVPTGGVSLQDQSGSSMAHFRNSGDFGIGGTITQSNFAGATLVGISGNVGIGTTAPGTTLDVVGTGRFSSTLTASSGLTLTTGALSLTGTSGSISLTGFGITSITSTTATGNINTLANDSLTTGTNLALTSTATALSSGGLLSLSKTGASGSTAYTGDIANVTYSQTFNGGVGLDSTGNVLDISRSITLNNTGNTHTISGALVTLSDSMTQTAGTLTHTASLLDLTQNYTSSTGTALYLKNYGSGLAFRVDDESGDTSPFVINGSGNVGIGTTAPTTLLETSQATDNILTIRSSTESVGNTAVLRFLTGTGSNDNTNNLASITSVITQADPSALKSDLTFRINSGDNSDEIMRITSGGNVGIGTTAASSKLEVKTNGLGTTQTTSSGLALVNLTAAAAGAQQISPAIRWSGFGWKTDATAASQAVDFRAFVTPVQGTANPTGFLGFGSSINGGAYSDNQLVLTSGGNVGIGTTAPSSLLYVKTGAITVDQADGGGQLQFSTAGTAKWLQYTSGNDFRLYDSDSSNYPFTVKGDGVGNVGIGTTAPGATLDIVSSITDAIGTRVTANSITTGDALRVVSTSTAGGASGSSIMLKLDRSGANSNTAHTAYGLYSTVTNTNATSGTNTAGYFSASGATTANFGIYSAAGTNYFNGNVGIGTTAPTLGMLQVEHSSATVPAGAFLNSSVSGASPAFLAVGGQNAGTGAKFEVGEGTSLSSYTSLFRIANSGNVGIGTTNPTSKLYIKNSSTDSFLLLDRVGTQTVNFNMTISAPNDGTDAVSFINSASGSHAADFIFKPASETAGVVMFMNGANGNVGIGVTAPDRKFETEITSTDPVARFTNSDGYCEIDPTATALSCTSDVRLKKDVSTLSNALDKVTSLRGVNFKWNTQTKDTNRIGFIAQEVESVIPELVMTDNRGFKSVNYNNFTPFLIEAVKQQQDQINQLKAMYQTDEEGNIVISNLKAKKIVVDQELAINGSFKIGDQVIDADSFTALASQTSKIEELASKVDAAELKVSDVEASQIVLGEQIATQSSKIDELKSQIDLLLGLNEATDSGEIEDDLNLTPPDILLATGSATLAKIDITEKASILNLEALDATVSATFKSLGETFLGKTTIAGDLNIDGTLSITSGNTIDAFPTLFLQSSPLAQAIDIFNGKVTISKEGKMSISKLELAKEAIGGGVISAGTLETTIFTTGVTSNSRIFITPTSVFEGNLAVVSQTVGTGFKVKTSKPSLSDIKFNWTVIEEKED